MNSFAFSVPMPPSANSMFATDFKTKRRFMSKQYSAWRKAAAQSVALDWRRCGSPKFERHLSLTIHIGLNYTGDISNRIKSIEDLLPHAIPDFPDDRYIDRITIERVKGIDGARVLILQAGPLEES